ncbi:MAG: hypothetical protein MUQ56_05635 [Thermoleophilia bacterium]|jgi:predicted mannosyl-3-phosphoglycerate phosphatase (HAD superfamily)|nr:hypothetical protein [Thermoleophilia bacterium]
MDPNVPLEQRPAIPAPVSELAASQTHAGVNGLPVLAHEEAAVLALMSRSDHCLTFGTIRSRSGLATAELRVVLESLRAEGLIVRLNTVVESYASRFPGLDVDQG